MTELRPLLFLVALVTLSQGTTYVSPTGSLTGAACSGTSVGSQCDNIADAITYGDNSLLLASGTYLVTSSLPTPTAAFVMESSAGAQSTFVNCNGASVNLEPPSAGMTVRGITWNQCDDVIRVPWDSSTGPGSQIFIEDCDFFGGNDIMDFVGEFEIYVNHVNIDGAYEAIRVDGDDVDLYLWNTVIQNGFGDTWGALHIRDGAAYLTNTTVTNITCSDETFGAAILDDFSGYISFYGGGNVVSHSTGGSLGGGFHGAVFLSIDVVKMFGNYPYDSYSRYSNTDKYDCQCNFNTICDFNSTDVQPASCACPTDGSDWQLMCEAQTMYVDGSAGRPAPCGWSSGSAACARAEDAINHRAGRNVRILPGTYVSTGDFVQQSTDVHRVIRSHSLDPASVTIDCDFHAGFQGGFGGELTLMGLTVQNCLRGEAGGAISAPDANVTVESCVFENCESQTGSDLGVGGAIYGGRNITVKDTTFTNCVSESAGSAIAHVPIEDGELVLTDCLMTGGSASYAAVYSRGNMTLVRTVIEGNSGGEFSHAGGVYHEVGQFSMTDSRISGNTGYFNGGLYLRYTVPSANFYGLNHIYGNVATYYGAGSGGVRMSTAGSEWVTITNLDLTNTIIRGNFPVDVRDDGSGSPYACDCGGWQACDWDGPSECTCTSDASPEDAVCLASEIYVSSGTDASLPCGWDAPNACGDLQEVILAGKPVVLLPGTHLIDVPLRHDHDLSIVSSNGDPSTTKIDCQAGPGFLDGLRLEGVTMRNCTHYEPRQGGAINAKAIDLVVDNCVFEHCRTADSIYLTDPYGTGGAIRAADVNATVTNTLFSHCSSRENGGAVYLTDSSDAVFENVTIDSCWAEEGYVFEALGSLVMTNTVIRNTPANTGSGAVRLGTFADFSGGGNFVEQNEGDGVTIYGTVMTGLSLENLVSRANTGRDRLSGDDCFCKGWSACEWNGQCSCPSFDDEGSQMCRASSLYVAPSGQSAPCGLTVETACDGLVDALTLDRATGQDLTLVAGTFTLEVDLPTNTDPDLVISGAGTTATIIDCDGHEGFRGPLSLSDVEVTGCQESAVRAYGDDLVVLTDVRITDSYSSLEGGGVSVAFGDLSMTNVEISGCSSNETGGGLYMHDGDMSLTDVEVSSCSARTHGGGVYAGDGSHTWTGVVISGNSASDGGGAYLATELDEIDVSGGGNVIEDNSGVGLTVAEGAASGGLNSNGLVVRRNEPVNVMANGIVACDECINGRCDLTSLVVNRQCLCDDDVTASLEEDPLCGVELEAEANNPIGMIASIAVVIAIIGVLVWWVAIRPGVNAAVVGSEPATEPVKRVPSSAVSLSSSVSTSAASSSTVGAGQDNKMSSVERKPKAKSAGPTGRKPGQASRKKGSSRKSKSPNGRRPNGAGGGSKSPRRNNKSPRRNNRSPRRG